MKKILSIILFLLLVCNTAIAVEYSYFFEACGDTVFLEESKDKAKGLMGRESLPPNTGMVFFYPSYEQESFWMKGMKFPIDIIFIKDGQVIKVYKNAKPCTKEICKIYPSKGVVNQVIEVNAGFCRKHKIKKGSIIWVQDLTRSRKHY